MKQGMMVFKGRENPTGDYGKDQDKLVLEYDGGMVEGLLHCAKNLLSIDPKTKTLIQIRNYLRMHAYKVIATKGTETLDVLHPKHNGWFKKNNDIHQKEPASGTDTAN
jgi:hypothetical protein